MGIFKFKLCIHALCISASLAAAIPVQRNQSAFDRILNLNKNSTQPLFEGDIVVNQLVEEVFRESNIGNVARDAVRNREYLWVARIVPYVIAKNYSASEQGIIEGAMDIIENETCVTFKKYTNESHWIQIEKSEGCSSSIGRNYVKPGMQTVSIGSGCLSTPIVLHELLHTLGFWHEQSRPDRDKFIEIFWENIRPGDEHNFEKYSHKEADTLGLPYDYSSVMHYTKTSSSKNGMPTMLAIGRKDIQLGNSNTLTSIDILQINRLYECETAADSKTYISSWTQFGPCDYNCEKKRQRFCFITDLSKCPNVNPNGVEEEVVKCPYEECYAPIDGHWGRWSTWGDCVPDCGPRKQVRTRKCNNPEPKYGGKSCQGEAEMSLACAPKSCSLECNFEHDWCGWTNSYTNSYRFKWLRVKGKTFSENTGPSRDHTTGNGYYIAVEASSPALPGDKARVMSKQRKAAVAGECIGFWYHMFGLHIVTLKLILKFENGDEKTIWSMTGNKGDTWIKGNVTAYSSKPYQVIFESERGNGYQGDIAIDDIGIQPGECGKGLTGTLNRPPTDPVGCFRDSVYDRAFPQLLESQRHTINWFSYESSLSRILKSCISKAKLKGYRYIGLQYYGECWSGPTSTRIYRHGPSNDCINGTFRSCSEPLKDLCTGQGSTNFIYRLL